MSVRAWLWNPIVAKEYRSRMRTMRSPLALTAYILAIGGLGWAVFSAMAYARVTGRPVTLALRDSQLKMLRSAARWHPFYWAPFIVVGEGW